MTQTVYEKPKAPGAETIMNLPVGSYFISRIVPPRIVSPRKEKTRNRTHIAQVVELVDKVPDVGVFISCYGTKFKRFMQYSSLRIQNYYVERLVLTPEQALLASKLSQPELLALGMALASAEYKFAGSKTLAVVKTKKPKPAQSRAEKLGMKASVGVGNTLVSVDAEKQSEGDLSSVLQAMASSLAYTHRALSTLLTKHESLLTELQEVKQTVRDSTKLRKRKLGDGTTEIVVE